MRQCNFNPESDAVLGGEFAAPAKKPRGLASPRIVLAYAACTLIWGTSWYGVRVSVAPEGFPPFTAALLRYAIASFLFVPIWFFSRHNLDRHNLKKTSFQEAGWIAISGLLSGLGYILLYKACQHISGGLAAVLFATSPLFALLLAATTRVEGLTRAATLGSIMAFSGVVLVFWDRMQISTAQGLAAGLLILTAFLSAASNVCLKRHAHHVPTLTVNVIFFVSATVLLWIVALVTGDLKLSYPPPYAATIAVLYLAVLSTFAAFICYFYFLKHVRLSTAMNLSFLMPVVALIVDALFERDSNLNAQTYAGIATVLLGVVICMLPRFETKTEVIASALSRKEAA
jgi:drug/metabolite transporter (DMT)-like permease